MNCHFFATLSRMRYIERWALMRNSCQENLSEHSLETAMIAHCLCEIGNLRYGRSLSGERAALLALYHDVPEIITGDMPTPVKYSGEEMQKAYRELERGAAERLLSLLPEDLRPRYEELFFPDPKSYLLRLVKAADKLSAYIKCLSEEQAGNQEFRSAKKSTERILRSLSAELPELSDFMRDFLPSYGRTLDELIGEADGEGMPADHKI